MKCNDLELVLDDGLIRDADGDIVMDTKDSIDYNTNGVPTTQYVKTHVTLYVSPVPLFTPSKYTFRFTFIQCIQRNGEEKTIDELKRKVQHMLTRHVWKPVLWDYHHHIQYVPEEEVRCRWEIWQAQSQIGCRGAATGQKCLL